MTCFGNVPSDELLSGLALDMESNERKLRKKSFDAVGCDVESEQTNVLLSSWFNHSRLQTLNGGSIQLAHSLLNTPLHSAKD